MVFHSALHDQVVEQVQCRTGRRIDQLSVDYLQDRLVLRGLASSFHLKQLAQHGVRDVLPQVPLLNAITVVRSA